MRYPIIAHALALSAATAAPAFAVDFYVAPSGSDTMNTGTQLSPFREIRRGLLAANAGDRVLAADGHYLGFDVASRNGTASSPITVQALGTGAIIDLTTDRADNRDTIFVTSSSWIVIDGLRSTGANRAATRIDGSSHITVRNCAFGNNAKWGIFTDFSDDLLLEGNDCYGSVSQHGIYVSNSSQRPIVRDNLLHNNAGCGLHLNGDVSQGGIGTITGALVERNVIWSNGAAGGSAINCDGVINSVIRGNLVYDAHAAGISLYQIDASAPSTNDVIVANTIDVASNGRWAIQLHNSSSGAIIFDNILVTHHASRGLIHIDDATSLVGLQSNRNVLSAVTNAVTIDDDASYMTLAQWQASGSGRDPNSLSSNHAALFIDWAAGDYRLLAGSPAIDAGVTTFASMTAPIVDLLGVSRPSGTAYDMGAYEVTGGGTTGGTSTGGTSTSGSGTTTGSASSGTISSTGTAGSGSGSGGGSQCGVGGAGALAAVALAFALGQRHQSGRFDREGGRALVGSSTCPFRGEAL